MVTIHAISGRTLALGREGENLARQVVFDISEWRASYGDGTVSLIAQRHGDAEPYPCNIIVDGDTVTWPITSADTACPDYGHCELRYSVGDVLVKSEMWRTFVADALGTPQPEPPEPQKAWVDKVLAAGQAAVDASVNSPKIGKNGNWFVWDFETGAYVDTGVAASGGGSGAVSSVNGQTGAVVLTAGDVGAVPVPATAAVGQTVRVKAVDEAGRPTEWEAADMAGGGDNSCKEKIWSGNVKQGTSVTLSETFDVYDYLFVVFGISGSNQYQFIVSVDVSSVLSAMETQKEVFLYGPTAFESTTTFNSATILITKTDHRTIKFQRSFASTWGHPAMLEVWGIRI